MEKKIKEYEKKFDDFPSFQLCKTKSEEEIIDIINQCLSTGKDVYELGYLSDEEYY